jgi:hypothetical protein
MQTCIYAVLIRPVENEPGQGFIGRALSLRPDLLGGENKISCNYFVLSRASCERTGSGIYLPVLLGVGGGGACNYAVLPRSPENGPGRDLFACVCWVGGGGGGGRGNKHL